MVRPPQPAVPVTMIAAALALASFAARPALAAPSEDRASLRWDAAPPVVQPSDEPAAPPPFGEKGSWWWSVGGGAAFGDPTTDGNYSANFELHTFLVDQFELGLEFGGTFFNQHRQDDAIGGNFNLNFRWHFISKERYTVFAEAGAGLLLATDEVPNGGSEFNFTPRAGMGMTWRFGEGPARLMFGVRWQHISNGRTQGGADRNPGTNNAMVYASILFPF